MYFKFCVERMSIIHSFLWLNCVYMKLRFYHHYHILFLFLFFWLIRIFFLSGDWGDGSFFIKFLLQKYIYLHILYDLSLSSYIITNESPQLWSPLFNQIRPFNRYLSPLLSTSKAARTSQQWRGKDKENGHPRLFLRGKMVVGRESSADRSVWKMASE